MADPKAMEGRSLVPLLTGAKRSGHREAVFASRERHSSARWNNLGYPQRCLRTADYLYIWNVHPER